MSTYEPNPQRELNQNLLSRIRELERNQEELHTDIKRILHLLKLNAHTIDTIIGD